MLSLTMTRGPENWSFRSSSYSINYKLISLLKWRVTETFSFLANCLTVTIGWISVNWLVETNVFSSSTLSDTQQLEMAWLQTRAKHCRWSPKEGWDFLGRFSRESSKEFCNRGPSWRDILWISSRRLLLPFPNLIPSRINLWSAQAQPGFLPELTCKSQHGPLQVTSFDKVRSIFNLSSQVIL